jgi:hypothetical protein
MIRRITNSKPWLWYTVLSGVFCVIASVYGLFDRTPKLEMQVITKTPILNSQVGPSSLRVFVDSVEVQASDKELTALTLLVSNGGHSELRDTDFESTPFGLSVENGVFIDRPVFIQSTSDFISQRITDFYEVDSSTSSNVQLLPKVSLDKNDSYTIRLFILSDNDQEYRLNPMGKIYGQRAISIYKESHQRNEQRHEPVFQQAFQGGFWVQLIRVLGYVIIGFTVYSWLIVLFLILKFIFEIIRSRITGTITFPNSNY